MKKFIIALLLTNLICAEGNKWGVDEDDHVAVLNKDNFDIFIRSHPFVMVKFYAPWCGHCKAMAPAYSKLAQRMKDLARGIPIAKVDATVEPEVAEKYEIKGFPTIKFFVEGAAVDYTGAREEEAMFVWIKSKTDSLVSKVKNLEEFHQLADKKIAVVFITSEDKFDTLKPYNTLAASIDDIPFYFTFSPEVKEHLGVTGDVSLVVLRNFDDGMKIISADSLDFETMKSFLDTHRHPLVMPFDQPAAERIFGSENSTIFLFTDETDNETTYMFKKAAEKFGRGQLFFSQSPITTGIGARLAEFMGVTANDANTVRIINFAEAPPLKYKLTDVTEDSLEKFIRDFQENKLTPYYKSEKVPEKNNQPVKVVVGDTFEEMVLKSDKDVLLEAYAPWCGHCKQLEPIYNSLATKLAGDKDLLVVKMDAVANEHPHFKVQGFPTVRLYKRGSKDTPVDFTGERTIEGFAQFLEKELGRTFDVQTSPMVDENL
jgi:protein disulfide-isomerase A1